MLKANSYTAPTEIDLIVFEKLIPEDHLLRKVKAAIDFERFWGLVKEQYSPDMGRGAEDPVVMIKLEMLQFFYGLSDREVLKQLQVNVAYRYFLDLFLDRSLPSSGLLSQFRARLGVERHSVLFEEVIRQVRQAGLVKDHLRLKDATHVVANVAIPSAIQLIAQARERLLRSAKVYARAQVEEEERMAEQIRKVTEDLSDVERLRQRLEHLRRIVRWADEVQQGLGLRGEKADPLCQRFDEMLAIGHRIVDESGDGEKKDCIRSGVDADARRGKHGVFYEGYKLDISMDEHSELITAVDILAANQDEAANAGHLVQQEQQAQGNRIEGLSIDGIGFRGDVLRQLKNPQGLNLRVCVPVHEWVTVKEGYFKASDFHLQEDGETLVCPAEEESRVRYRNGGNTSWVYYFTIHQCKTCPLLPKCMPTLTDKHGRMVAINDYEAEYQAARTFAQTETYRSIRKQHPKIERKLAEIIRYHQGRRTRYRGTARVTVQYLLTTLVVNLKRIVKLLQGAAACLSPA